MITTLDGILEAIADRPCQTVAVAVAEKRGVIEAVSKAQERGICKAILVGDSSAIEPLVDDVGMKPEDFEIVHADSYLAAAQKSCELVRSDEAQILMKGHIHTDDFLRALLDKERGLRSDTIMSHVFILETKARGKLTLVTDGAMNIAPDLEMKAHIILNAVYLANVLGLECPKVGVLAAVEVVNPKMPATLDAAALHTMAQRGQFPNCQVDGPFALDNAVSALAARIKGIPGEIAGDCDILLCPSIEAGNMLTKCFSFLGGGRTAGVLIGAAAPVVLTSRADTPEAKMHSIAAAVLTASLERSGMLKFGRVHF